MPTDPTLILVTTTAAIPREGEGVRASDLNWLLDFRDDEIASLKADHAEATRIFKHYTEHLKANLDSADRERWEFRAELAERDETIAEVVEESVKLLKANCDKAQEIGSLRTQLDRAGAIEEAAREVDRIRWKFDDNIDSWALKHAIDRLATALASPSPRDTAEGERKPKCPGPEGIAAIRAAGGSDWDKVTDVRAFLGRDEDERVARLIRAADTAIADHYEAGGIGRVVEELRESAEACRGLAELDKTEATQCPSR